MQRFQNRYKFRQQAAFELCSGPMVGHPRAIIRRQVCHRRQASRDIPLRKGCRYVAKKQKNRFLNFKSLNRKEAYVENLYFSSALLEIRGAMKNRHAYDLPSDSVHMTVARDVKLWSAPDVTRTRKGHRQRGCLFSFNITYARILLRR